MVGTPPAVSATQTFDFDARQAAAQQAADAFLDARPKPKGLFSSIGSGLWNWKFTLALTATAVFLATPYGAAYRPVVSQLFWDTFNACKEKLNPPPPPPPPPSGWFG